MSYTGYGELEKNHTELISKIKYFQRLSNRNFIEEVRRVREQTPKWSQFSKWEKFIWEEIEFRKLPQ